jgi:hypothetical protein
MEPDSPAQALRHAIEQLDAEPPIHSAGDEHGRGDRRPKERASAFFVTYVLPLLLAKQQGLANYLELNYHLAQGAPCYQRMRLADCGDVEAFDGEKGF